MTKNKILFIILFYILFVQSLIAQKGFYLKPFLKNTIYKTFTDGDNKTIVSPTEYFILKKEWVLPYNFSPLDLGVYIGYQFTNYSLETGISQEGAISGLYLAFLQKYGTSNTYYNSYFSISSGTAGMKIPFVFNYVLLKKDSLNRYKKLGVSLQFTLGLSYYTQPDNYGISKPLTSLSADSIQIGQDVFMSYTTEMYSLQTKTLLYTIGLGFDLNRKGKNLFSFNVYFQDWKKSGRYGKRLSGQYMGIRIDDANKKQQLNYNYFMYSNAGGFVFELSHKIYWRDFKRKEKQTEMRFK